MTEVAKRIAEWLVKKKIITYSEIELYEYGAILLITTTIGAISMLVISGLTFGWVTGVIQLLMFSSLRVCSGGYHCKTYFSCFIASNCIFIINLIFAWCLRMLPSFHEVIVSICLMVLTSTYIIWNAPVLNSNNPLTNKRKEKNRKRAIQTTLCLLLISVICSVLLISYEAPSLVLSNATSAQCSVVALMLIEKNKQKGEKKKV